MRDVNVLNTCSFFVWLRLNLKQLMLLRVDLYSLNGHACKVLSQCLLFHCVVLFTICSVLCY